MFIFSKIISITQYCVSLCNKSNFQSAIFSQILQNTLKNNININNSKSTVYNEDQVKKKKFPVDDKILFKNPDKYEIDIENFERPEFTKLKIPD